MTAHLFEALETQIVESRSEPRYTVTEQGTLAGARVTVRNVSRTGAQLACPVQDYRRLEEALREPLVTVELFLKRRLGFTAEVIYAHRAGEEYLMGVHFVEVDALERALLDEYIRTLL